MEQTPQNTIINIPNSRKRKHGPMHVIRVAIFMMSGRNRNSKALQVNDGSKSMWMKLVGSMRPLHLQSNQSPRHPKSSGQPLPVTPSSPSSPSGDEGDEAVTPTSNFLVEESYSPSPPRSRFASAIGLNELVFSDDDNGKRSRYASAIGLNELVESDEDNENHEEIIEEKEECEENGDGDEMIDAKADEFIAQFYKQMRLQRFDVVDRHYKERSKRSLGS